MSKKYKHIDHLTPELINQYREGSLSTEEMYAVEKYLLDNPFEAEALEGLEMVTSEELSGHLETLSSDIDKRTREEQETRIVFWTNTRRMAAGLVILLAASFMYFWLPEGQTLESDKITTKELSQNKKAEEEKSIPEAASAQLVDSVESEKTESPGQADSLVNPQTTITQLQATSDLNKDSVSTEINKSDLLVADLEISNRAAEEEIVEALDLSEIEATPVLRAAKAQAVPEVKMDSSVVLNFSDALDSFKAENSINVDSQRSFAFTPTIIDSRAKLVADANLGSSGSVITGIVKGRDDGLPLPQVTVVIQGTTIGVPTDANGEFSISADTTNGFLRVSYLGYKSQIIPLTGKSHFDISLEPDTQSLGEVVTTARGRRGQAVMVTRGSIKSSPARPEVPFDEYVAQNLRYPPEARARNIKGRVTVEFTVKATGVLADIKVIKGLGFGCDKEAIRLVQEGPAWMAKVERKTGKYVDSKVKVRIRFKP